MENQMMFQPEELPYEKLAKLGISEEKLRSMPKELTVTLLEGRVTPLFVANVTAEDGKVISLPIKAQMMRDEEGKLLLMTYPVRKDIANDLQLSDKELNRVKDGEVIRKEVEEDGGRKVKFVQLDRETRSLMFRNVGSVPIDEKLQDIEKVKDIELGANQKQAIKDGKPVEQTLDDTKVTVGVDLREPQGFKVVKGDLKEWERQQQIRYDNAHEEFMGFVMTDENRWEYRKVTERLSSQMSEGLSEKKEKNRGLKR